MAGRGTGQQQGEEVRGDIERQRPHGTQGHCLVSDLDNPIVKGCFQTVGDS